MKISASLVFFFGDVAFALVNPLAIGSSARYNGVTALCTTSGRCPSALNANAPPEFTIEDGDDDDVTAGAPRASIPPPAEYKVETDHTEDNDDPYAEDTSSRTTTRRPKVPRKKIPRATSMVGTSWMEKNDQFTPEDADGMAMNDSVSDQTWSKKQDGMKETRSKMDAKTFRQDFRGTRVFVQGIPDGTSWQDLKDHFKTAGSVVFASVSVDPRTGEAKGHGIVQFETTGMAQNAIGIMRDYPLNGAALFVREDVQESNNPNARLSDNAPRGPTPPTKWKCANEENAAYMSPNDLEAIRALIKARDFARMRRKYEVSDRIRDELKHTHGVFIDDRLKMWWTAIDGNKVPQTVQDIKGDGRWKIEPWRQIPTTPENDACVNPDLVEGFLKQRDISRREKDFGTADALLEEARTSPDGDLTLRIHDESRTWRVWTDAPPPRPFDERGPDHDRDRSVDPKERAVMECIEIVEEYAPHKVEEIQMVLKKFEGREYQVLKRLKNQYLS
jgi:RNA recognition motif-containing protein